jgi:microcystin-dependent protein
MAWSVPRTWVTGELVTSSQLNTELRDNLNSVLPVGAIIMRAANYQTVETAVESRWLQCNGVAVSRSTYSALFNYLNGLSPALPFGTGDGVTTFTLPDARGRAAYAEGEHADVDSMNDSEGATIANRRPFHGHELPWGHSLGLGLSLARGASTDATFGSGALGEPSYIVLGSYFIKYTA